ncbi:MAG: MMCAP2_0565 family pilin-like conjugal transfer protein [Patescibacteria group bacterium]
MGDKPQKRNIFLLVFLVFFVFLGFFVVNPNVFAATSYSIEDVGGAIGLGTVDLKTLVINIIKWVLGILSLVAVSYLIYGGVLWMTSRGNEEKIAKAKKTIVNAVIGIIIVLLAWAIVLLVARFITNAGGGGSISCTANVDRDPSNPVCRVCNNLGNGYVYMIRPNLIIRLAFSRV